MLKLGLAQQVLSTPCTGHCLVQHSRIGAFYKFCTKRGAAKKDISYKEEMSRPAIQENLTKDVTAWSNGKFNLQEKKKKKKAAMKYSIGHYQPAQYCEK